MTLDDWNMVIGVNLTGQFLCASSAVREIHLAGHSRDHNDGDPILIDTHGAVVADAV